MKTTKYLEEIIKEHGMNINQVAKKTGTTASTFYSFFSRDCEPTMDLLLKISYALGMNPMDLLLEMEADKEMLDMMAFLTTQDSQVTDMERLKRQLCSLIDILDYGNLNRFVWLAKVFLQLSTKEQRLMLKIADLFVDDWEKRESYDGK